MPAVAYSFGPFRLDPADRRLTRDGEPVEVSSRYLDALILLVDARGRLVTKDRFLDEVWNGVPVTDEALTQCIRSLRRALDDDAASPRYIETVPRHGYRLIAPVEQAVEAMRPAVRAGSTGVPMLLDILAAALGGGIAGVVGALSYIALGLVSPGIGAASTLLVLISVNLVLGLVGGAAVGGGLALADRKGGAGAMRLALGGAAGGVLIGGVGRMLGSDLFALFFGRVPASPTGALEGLILGLASGLALALALRRAGSPVARMMPGFVLGGLAGAAVALAGGRLMAGNLVQLAASFPESRLRLEGALFGESGLGPLAFTAVTAFEAALFTGCVVSAMVVGRKSHSSA